MSSLENNQVLEFAQILHNARKSAKEIEPLSKTFGEFSLPDAYRIQKQGIDLRLREGEKIIGYKMGLTSKAKMEQMGLHTPIFGVLTQSMQVANQDLFPLVQKIHPKAEPEIYFVTNNDLQGNISIEDACAACKQVGVALEILDSRYKGFKYFTLPDVVADNSSSAYFVLGDGAKPSSNPSELLDLKIELLENKNVVHAATSNAILGNPWLSLCELVHLLDEYNQKLPAGSIVLAGAATAAIELKPNQEIMATLNSNARVSFRTN